MAERILCRTLPSVGDEIEIWEDGELCRVGTVDLVDVRGDDHGVWYTVTRWVSGYHHSVGSKSWGKWNSEKQKRYRVRFIEEG